MLMPGEGISGQSHGWEGEEGAEVEGGSGARALQGVNDDNGDGSER